MNEKKAINTGLSEELGYQSRILSISFEIRILNLLVGLIAINILKKVFCFPFSGEIFAVLYLWLLTCVIYLVPFKLFLLKTKKGLERVHFSYYFLGIAYVTVFAHFLGGIEWIAFVIYLFDLVYANVLMKRLKP